MHDTEVQKTNNENAENHLRFHKNPFKTSVDETQNCASIHNKNMAARQSKLLECKNRESQLYSEESPPHVQYLGSNQDLRQSKIIEPGDKNRDSKIYTISGASASASNCIDLHDSDNCDIPTNIKVQNKDIEIYKRNDIDKRNLAYSEDEDPPKQCNKDFNIPIHRTSRRGESSPLRRSISISPTTGEVIV